ncbi:hypothetical protein JQS43_02070 [Natronosporangium hydrolyticum]|uniref:Secreted protein n=1 Tax=Natronosporangium hydrolyticum TaxID=2811111 RepID=A0A895YGG0_9ACTN|nr:hypothetical protein [Natronosporangium hydrolyticum]QSB15182.1 hypothetical protein JQS43_02070 [Natronosporangium hydrolyticum]
MTHVEETPLIREKHKAVWWKAAAVATSTVLAGVLGMAAPAAAAPAAQQSSIASPTITFVYGSSATDANLWKGVDLSCTGAFLGGGGYVSGPESQNAGLSQIAPGSRGGAALDDPRSMRVSATAAPDTTPANWTLHAYGICAHGLPGVEYQRDYVSAAGSGRGPLTALASCSPGKSLVGMGGQAFAIPEQVRLSTVAPGNGVVIARVTPQPNPTASWAVQAIAVCANHNAAEIVSGSTGVDNRAVKNATAHCPAGQGPTGAGFGHTWEAGNLVQSMLIPTSDRLVGVTRTDTRPVTGNWGAGVYALCLPT